MFSTVSSPDNRRNWWTAGDGRCPSHILYLELVEIATMILCVPQDRCDLKILSWLGVPWWQGLIHLSITCLGWVAQPQYGKLFVQESCPLSWRIYSSSILPSTDKLPGAPLLQVVPMKNVFRPHQYLLLREITPGSHVLIWELDNKEGWALKNWCFWTVVLEKTLENPLDSKEIKLVSPKGNQSWIFIGRTDAEAEAPILWPRDVKRSWCWERWKAKGEEMAENEMVGWHHWLSGHEFEQTLGDNEGQGSLKCCSPWGCKELDRI